MSAAILALTYSTSNVGDDIQTLAMLRHAPEGAAIHWCDRDKLADYDGPPARLLANGWWAHGERAWPPPPHVEAFCLSVHVQKQSRALFERAGFPLSGERQVGARDTETLAWLERLRVPSFFSRCLTLTFERSAEPRKGVIAVDLKTPDERHVRALCDAWKEPFTAETHKIDKASDRDTRIARALALLDCYRSAALVVTSRLHVALPCAAMGTPVVLIGQSNRFAGLTDHFAHLPVGRNRMAINRACEAALGTPYRDATERAKRELTALARAFLAGPVQDPMADEVEP